MLHTLGSIITDKLHCNAALFSDSKKAKCKSKWNRGIYGFYCRAPTVLLRQVVCGRPAVVEYGNKASSQHACPQLWSSSRSSLAWRQQACINKGELLTGPQKDGWLHLLWFAAVLPPTLALFKCGHHVQLQDKSTHSLPPDASCWIQSYNKRLPGLGITKRYQSGERMIHPGGGKTNTEEL